MASSRHSLNEGDGYNPPIIEVFYFYILKCHDGTYYTGCTGNLDDRLNHHQKGWVPATKSRTPLMLETYVVFKDKQNAFAFEKYLKSGSGRAFMRKRLVS